MRLFVALDLDDDIRSRIAGFLDGVRGFAPEARWARPESLHVTLKFIGEQSEAQVDEIKRALAAIEADHFAMNFRGFGGSRDNNRNGGGLGALLMLIVAPIAALLIQLGISRQREFAADASGAKMVGHPYGLISALEKLGAYNQRIPMDVSPATASLFIVAPLSAGQVFSGLFSTHPPLSERIAVLRNMAVTRQV